MAKKKPLVNSGAEEVCRPNNGPLTASSAPEASASSEGQESGGSHPPLACQSRGEGTSPADADLSYIAADLRSLAVRIDSLVLDDMNVKDHGEADLPTHAASLREFGIQRAIVCHRETRKILAGNGSVMAATRNGWSYVPVIWFDGDLQKARAFALADNAVGTLAGWNEENLKAIAAECDSLFTDDLLKSLTRDLDAQMDQIEKDLAESAAEDSEQKETKVTKELKGEDIQLSYGLVVTCADQKAQLDLLAELENRGISCRISTSRIKD